LLNILSNNSRPSRRACHEKEPTMSTTRNATFALAGAAALFAVKNLRHADEASLGAGPFTRVAVHEIEDGHAADAISAAQAAQGAQEGEKR
jgi:hypothetical protein